MSIPACRLALVVAALALAGPARAETVRVFTSYMNDMMDVYERGFSKAHPDIKVEFQWGFGADAIAALRKPDQDGVDVLWSPGVKAFPVLAREGAFRPLGSLAQGVETSVGGLPLGDAKGTYTAFEMAAYGFVYNPDYLSAHNLPVPKDWDDLAKPVYAGHILVPVPSRAGYASAMMEIPLQRYGWADGWALLAELAANATLLDEGGGMTLVRSAAEGKTGIGLTMDFFARLPKTESAPVKFAYPASSPFGLSPAYVAITAKAPHAKAAEAFVRFVLSDEGQRLLMSPEAMRLPVRKAVYDSTPAGYPRPFDDAAGAFRYDLSQARARQPVVTALFDEFIAARHARITELFAAIRQAEAAGNRDAAQKARTLAVQLPLTEAQAGDGALIAALENGEADTAKAIRAEWARRITENTDRAFAALGR